MIESRARLTMIESRARLMMIAAVLCGWALPALAQETVIIPTRVIYPGEAVTADSLEEVPLRRTLRNPAAVVLDWSQLEGMVARRTLLPGRMISVSSVREAHLVEPGQPVQVLAVEHQRDRLGLDRGGNGVTARIERAQQRGREPEALEGPGVGHGLELLVRGLPGAFRDPRGGQWI